MNKSSILIFALLMAPSLQAQETETPVPTVTPTPTVPAYTSAAIHYQIAGPQCSGQEVLYIKGSKSRRERHVTTVFMEQSKVENNLEISDGTSFFYINLDTGKGTRQTVDHESESLGTIIGQEIVMDKPCTVYQILGQKTWIWEKLVLKVEADASTKTATSLELNIPLDDSLFLVPPAISISEINL